MTEPGEGDGAKEDEIKSPEYNMADFEWLRQKGFTERDSTSLAGEPLSQQDDDKSQIENNKVW